MTTPADLGVMTEVEQRLLDACNLTGWRLVTLCVGQVDTTKDGCHATVSLAYNAGRPAMALVASPRRANPIKLKADNWMVIEPAK